LSKNFVQSSLLRATAISTYRVWARAQFWRSGPRVAINSIPKAGTHLLTKLLEAGPGLVNSRLHLSMKDVRPDTFSAECEADSWAVDPEKLERALSTVRQAQMVSCHLPHSPETESVFAAAGFKIVNLVRDPRDMLVSNLHYIIGLRRHFLHIYLTESLSNNTERLQRLIDGPTDASESHDGRFRSYSSVLEAYEGWLESGALTVRYEDLNGERSGRTSQEQHAALSRVFRHIGLPDDEAGVTHALDKAVGKRSATLRAGRSGDWANEFGETTRDLFDQKLGRFLSIYGYE
jgi:hypothetical protein